MIAINIELTEEQRAAVDTLTSLKKDIQTLGGFAGTGKTTVIKELVNRLPDFKVCAYTGKATQVLRRKDIPATTIHSLIYYLEVDDEGKPVEPVTFHLIPPMEQLKGIIVDEASMVGRDIYKDLTSLGVPLIFVGDHGQLEPVGDSSFNLMKDPQVTLTKIHRNAGVIARFAEHLRMGKDAGSWETPENEDPKVTFLHSGNWESLVIGEEDQAICAYNKTRVGINNLLREYLGRKGTSPEAGDRIICLQNDRRSKLYNGMQGTVGWINSHELLFKTGDREVRVNYVPEAFGSERKPEYCRNAIPFDFAYCVTCHKAQGDEWDNVVVFEQRCQAWSPARWNYTAASRAKKKLTWILEG